MAMNKLILGTALAALLATPALAQSYSATYGSGNIVNLPLAEATNGAAGVGASAYDGAGMSRPKASSSFAYAPRHRRVSKH
jgi:hypothetical protein